MILDLCLFYLYYNLTLFTCVTRKYSILIHSGETTLWRWKKKRERDKILGSHWRELDVYKKIDIQKKKKCELYPQEKTKSKKKKKILTQLEVAFSKTFVSKIRTSNNIQHLCSGFQIFNILSSFSNTYEIRRKKRYYKFATFFALVLLLYFVCFIFIFSL